MGVETIIAIVAIAASAAGSAISYASAQTQAKQSELNAQAQSDAIGQEQKRRSAEDQENQRRAAVAQQRIRAQQMAAISSTGVLPGTGSALAIEADTWQKQQVELADRQRVNELAQQELGYQALSIREQAGSEASAMRRNATGSLVTGLLGAASSGYRSFSTLPQTIGAN